MFSKKTVLSFLYKYSRIIVLVLLFLIFTFATDTFFSFSNTLNFRNIVAQQAPFLMLLGIGMAMAIILKGIDLSIGSVLALSSCIAAMVLVNTGSIILCILTGLAVGAFFGTINGILISRLALSPFIATYTVQWVTKGIGFVILGGKQIYNFPDNFRALFSNWFYTLLLIAVVIAILMGLIMSKTIFGRNMYVTGSNINAAKLSGINTSKVIIISYAVSGMLAALVGIMYIANLGAAEPVIGENFPLKAIAAALIGGITFEGGKGTVVNCVIGAFIMVMLVNGLLHLGVHNYWQELAIGFTIILSIMLERVGKRFVSQ